MPGSTLHGPWRCVIASATATEPDVDAIWSDDGIAFRFPDADNPPGVEDVLLDPEDVESLLLEHLGDTALFAARFREAAAGRSLLLPRRRPGERTPLWLRGSRSADLLGVAKQFGSFPIMLEVYREILQDDFDLPSLIEVLTDIPGPPDQDRIGRSRLTEPVRVIAALLVHSCVPLRGGRPLAERRAAALTLDATCSANCSGRGSFASSSTPKWWLQSSSNCSA